MLEKTNLDVLEKEIRKVLHQIILTVISEVKVMMSKSTSWQVFLTSELI